MTRQSARQGNNALLLSGLISVVLLLFTFLPTTSVALDRLSVAYCADCYPFQFRDENGNPAGSFIDQWRLWSKKSGVTVEFKAASWSESLRQVRNGEADAHAGLTYNFERDRFLDFGAYLGKSDTRVFLHRSLPPIASLEQLSAYRIGFIAGDPVEEFLKKRFPTANIIPFKDYEAIIAELENGKLKVFAADTLTGIYFLGERGMAAEFSYPESNLLFQSEWFLAVAEDRTDLLAQVNEGMAEITPNENQAIAEKWLANKNQKEEGALRIAIDWNYPPFALLNAKGEPDGLLVDLWKLWSRKTGRPVEFLSSRRKDTFSAVRDGTADFHAGLVSISDHDQWLGYSEPIFDVASNLFFLPSKGNVTDLGSLKGRKIGVVDGSYHEAFLVASHPESQIVRFESVDQILSNLLAGVIDAYLGEEPTVESVARRLGIQNTLGRLQEPLFTREVRAGVLQGREDLRAFVNKGISAMSEDEIAEIAQRWIPEFGESQVGAAGSTTELTSKERAWIKANPRIRVHNETDWPPFNFATDGNPQGYSIDYMNMLAEQVGLDVEYVTGPSWNEFLGKMKDGSLDVMLNIVKTTERQKYLLYTPPYADNPNTIISRKEDGYENLEQLFGKTVSVPKGFFYEEVLKRNFPQIKLHLVKGTLETMKAVAFGKADAAVGELAVFSYLLDRHLMTGLAVSGEVKMGNPELSLLNIATRKDLPVLASILRKGVKSIGIEDLRTIQRRWLGETRAAQAVKIKLNLTEAEKTWLSEHKEMRLGVDPDYPPFEFSSETGEYSGIGADYTKLIADRLGISMKAVPGLTWAQVIVGAKAKTIDVLPVVTPNIKRAEYLNFTQPHIRHQVIIITRDGYPFISGVEDLKDEPIALVKNYNSSRVVKERYPDLKIDDYDSSLEALTAVSDGRATGTIQNLSVATYLIRKHNLSNLKLAAPLDYKTPGHAYGVRKDWPELVSILNKVMASITPEEENAINARWVAVRMDHAIDRSELIKVGLQVGGVGTVIVLIIFIWNRRLRRATIEARNAQTALEESDALIKAFLDNANAMMFVKGPDRRYILVNRAFAEFRGFEPEEMAGKLPSELSNPVYTTGHDDSDSQAIQSGRSIVREIQATGADGRMRDFVVNKFPVIGQDGRLIALGAVLSDFTEHKETERALQEAKEIAEKAAESKSDFLAVVSHEVRTPMNGVLGMARLLVDTDLDSKQSEFADTIVHSSESLLGILNDLLDISKLEAGKLEIETIPFDPQRAVNESVAVMTARAKEKGVALDCEMASELPAAVVGDPHRTRQVLLNLISNGIKFTAEGHVSVKLAVENSSDEMAELIVSVTDTGIGIPKKTQEKLFSPYTQGSVEVARKYGGTGLGLAICRRLANLMGGELTVESTIGKGSCFTLRVPMRIATAEEIRATEKAGSLELESVPTLSPQRVLLVEDNIVNQKVAAAMLEKAGHHMDLAEHGEQALAMFEANEYDIVLMDRHMPVMDGIEATRKIRKMSDHGASVPIVGVTAAANKSEIAECMDAGMDDVIIKPIDPDELTIVMAATLSDANGEHYFSIRTGSTERKTSMNETTEGEHVALDPGRIETLRADYGDELATSLIVDFRRVAAEGATRIIATAESGEWADLKREAHGLKGSAMTLGLSALSAHCRAIELACIDEDWDTVINGAESLQDILNQAIAALNDIASAS